MLRSLSFIAIYVFLFLSLGSTVYGQEYQNIIKGKVYDADSGLPLPAANVYLSNTTSGDATNKLGAYKIKNIPPGNYDLVYNFIGYEQLATNIDIGIQDTLTFEVRLKYTPYKLDSLIVSNNRDGLWRRNLDRFIRHFIGKSNNARQTKLMNAEVLDFNIESFGIYTAKAQQELHIVNRALGYESFVQLEHFKWNYFEDTGQAFYYVRMNELKPRNEEQKREWTIKRSTTYNKSIRKFFVGLLKTVKTRTGEAGYDSSADLQSFDQIIYDNQRYKLFNGKIKQVVNKNKYKEYAPEKDQYQVWGFKFNTFYGKMPLSVIPDDGEVSYLDYYDKQADEYIFTIDSNGHLLNPLDVAIGGYWSNFRFADFLPLNYKPEKNL